jgi:hypothetical protein
MVSGVKKLAGDWMYDTVSIGYPGPVLCGRPISEPYNLGRGWVGFDFGAAFGCPVKVVNDAAMQALGSYMGGKMLWASERGSDRPLLSTASWSPWSSVTCPTRRALMRIMSAGQDWNATARSNGGATLPTSWPASLGRWSPTTRGGIMVSYETVRLYLSTILDDFSRYIIAWK